MARRPQHELLYRQSGGRHGRGLRASAVHWHSNSPRREPGSPCRTSMRRAWRDTNPVVARGRCAQLHLDMSKRQAVFEHADGSETRFWHGPFRFQQCRRHRRRYDRAHEHRGNRVAARHQPVGRDLRHQGVPAHDAGAARGLHRQHFERLRPRRLTAAGRLQHLQVRRARASPSACGANSRAAAYAPSACTRAASRPTSTRPDAVVRPPARRKRHRCQAADNCCLPRRRTVRQTSSPASRAARGASSPATTRRRSFWLSRLLPNSYPAVLKKHSRKGGCPQHELQRLARWSPSGSTSTSPASP